MKHPALNPSPSLPCRSTRRHRIEGGEGSLTNRLAALRTLGLLAGLAFLLSCSDRLAGGTSETETGTAAGTLFQKGGAPVQGARVTLFPAGEDTAKAITAGRTAFTDAGGAYRFDSLAFDTYNLTAVYVAAGTRDTLVASNLRIEITKAIRNVQVGADTLRGPGAISARVMFQSNPVEEALCYVPGTSYLALTDSEGRCLLSGIPPGRYRLSFKADGYLTTKAKDTVQAITGDTVQAGEVELRLDDQLAPPKPNGLSATFDSSSRKVTLAWSKVPAADLEGYALFRDSVPAVNFTRLTPDRLVKDTFYVDSLPGWKTGVDTLLAYRIKAQDKSGEQSRFGLFDTVRIRIPRINKPPSAPSAPRPVDSSAGATLTQTLRWISIDPDGDGLKADVYFGTANPPLERKGEAVQDSFFVVSGLDSLTQYFWRVLVTDGRDTIMGPVWSFTTGVQAAEGWEYLGAPMRYASDMWFIDKNVGWIGGANGNISRTPDGGRTWFPQSTGSDSGTIRAVQFTDSLNGWAVGDTGIFIRTRDGGANWTRMEKPDSVWFWDAFFVDALRGWVAGHINYGNGAPIVLKTEDGGTTWSRQTVENSLFINSVFFLNPDTGFIAGTNYGAQGTIYKTVDGGRNWDPLDSMGVFSPTTIQFIDSDTGWVGGNTQDQKMGVVARTVDGGRSWSISEAPGTTRIESLEFQDGMTGWATGAFVYKTVDGGRSWQKETVGKYDGVTTFNGVTTYFNLDGDHGWAAGMDGAVYQRPPLAKP